MALSQRLICEIGKRGLESEPENYSMKMMNDPEFRGAYSELVTAKRELSEFAPISDKDLSIPETKPRYSSPKLGF